MPINSIGHCDVQGVTDRVYSVTYRRDVQA